MTDSIQLNCEICWKSHTPADVWTVRAAAVANATSKGYTPTGLPLTWLPRLHLTLARRWNKIVEMHPTADWKLCKECWEEVKQFPSGGQTIAPEPAGQILVLASVYCAHIIRMEGQTLLLNFGGAEHRVSELLILFSRWANTQLTPQEIIKIEIDATQLGRIEEVNRDDMLAVIAKAHEIAADPPNGDLR